MAANKPTGYVIYRGPSLLDGAPIVAIALTGKSSNVKTGPMVQTYIIREDVHPLDALASGADASVCGNCKHRPYNGGACYVNVGQGVAVVYKTYRAGKYPATTLVEDLADMGRGRMVRLGTYGDPAAVPATVWQALTRDAAGHTGYTHQWGNSALPDAHQDAIRGLCMVSVDNEREAHLARAMGLRYFRIRKADEPIGPREFVCPASEEGGKRETCATCGACDGTAKLGKGGSAVIIVHGSKARRFASYA